jgi:hypothetical protein
MGQFKGKLIFVAEVAAAFAVVYYFQKKVYAIPVVGPYLPGGQ